MFPQARGLIKYLVADGRYDYIETGALLSIKQNIDKIVLPYEEAFFWLEDARICNLSYASTDPIVGLSLNKEYRSLKSYMADTGLLVTLAFADKNATDEAVYRSILRGNIGINEGMLVENFVAQMLVAAGHKLFFYSQSGHKEGEERMEIGFLITRPYTDAAGKPRISSIEVKSLASMVQLPWTG